jgi:hypothetical protein
MSEDTDYKRLWRREQENNRKLYAEIARLTQINEAQIDVLRRVRDGELDPKAIFTDEKLSDEVKSAELVREQAEKEEHG